MFRYLSDDQQDYNVMCQFIATLTLYRKFLVFNSLQMELNDDYWNSPVIEERSYKDFDYKAMPSVEIQPHRLIYSDIKRWPALGSSDEDAHFRIYAYAEQSNGTPSPNWNWFIKKDYTLKNGIHPLFNQEFNYGSGDGTNDFYIYVDYTRDGIRKANDQWLKYLLLDMFVA